MKIKSIYVFLLLFSPQLARPSSSVLVSSFSILFSIFAGQSPDFPWQKPLKHTNPHLNTTPSTMSAPVVSHAIIIVDHPQNINQQNMHYVRVHMQFSTLYLGS